MDIHKKLITTLNNAIEPIENGLNKYSSLLDKIGNSRFVLIGEATHGTHEFYQTRIEITQELIRKKGFMAVAIEGDWPDAYSVHRYLQGDTSQLRNALDVFQRFPTWMWRNKTMLPFLEWLRSFNDKLTLSKKIGFFGLDLYSLNASAQAVINYLLKVDPRAALRAKERYSCFDHFDNDPQTYGYLTNLGIKKPCIKEVVDQLIELQHHAFTYVRKDGVASADEYFITTQNARVVKDAEHYYRSMFEGRVSSWNVRDIHMAETVNNIADHLEAHFNKPAKLIIWAHNSHVGDARATELGEKGEINIGQLIKEQHPAHTYSIGFTTYTGTVTASSSWDGDIECKRINPGLVGSYEALFHELNAENFILDLQNDEELEHYLKVPRLQRAIGVIYLPHSERDSHYFFAKLPYQFDSVFHLDTTNALEPLE